MCIIPNVFVCSVKWWTLFFDVTKQLVAPLILILFRLLVLVEKVDTVCWRNLKFEDGSLYNRDNFQLVRNPINDNF